MGGSSPKSVTMRFGWFPALRSDSPDSQSFAATAALNSETLSTGMENEWFFLRICVCENQAGNVGCQHKSLGAPSRVLRVTCQSKCD